MYEEEKRRLVDNVVWFEQFFDDLIKLLQQIARDVQHNFLLPQKKFYTPGNNVNPIMPSFYGLYMKGEIDCVQIFVILNPGLIRNTTFLSEPSIAVLKHSRADVYQYSDELLSVLAGSQSILWDSLPAGMVGGEFLDGYAKGAQFYAFQAPLDSFINNSNPTQAIRTEIIEPLSRMPAWKEK